MTKQDEEKIRCIVTEELRKQGIVPMGRHREWGLCPGCIQQRWHTDEEMARYHSDVRGE